MTAPEPAEHSDNADTVAPTALSMQTSAAPDDAPPSNAPPSLLTKPPLDPRVLANVITSYEGDTIDVAQCDLPVYHGHGVAVFRTGFTYSGVFEYGRMHGHGRIEWVNGVVYDGEFVDSEMTGRGSYTWPNGSSYDGDVVRGRRHGHGSFRTGTRGVVPLPQDPNASEQSTDAEQHPLVMPPLHFLFSDYDSPEQINAIGRAHYEGQWVDGLPHGRGVLVFDDDHDVRYEGDFIEGKRHGHGEMRYASGNVYTGQWAEDVKCSQGTMLWMAVSSNGTHKAVEKYDGEWRDDRPHGHGRHVWLGSDRQQREKNWYEGDFVGGVRHGVGAFFYANGARYEGEWLDNVKQGTGVFFHEDGRVFVGDFRDDRAVQSADQSAQASSNGKIVLYVDELLPSEARDRARKLIENAVLRINTELRVLYRQYITLPAPASPTRQSISPAKAALGGETSALSADSGAILMEYYECRRLLADSGVRLSGGDLEHHLERIREAQLKASVPANKTLPKIRLTDPVTLATLMPEVVPPVRVLLFREFVELLVRLAHIDEELRHDALERKPAASLAEAFASFYEQMTRCRQQLSNVAPADVSWGLGEQLHTKQLHSVYHKHHHGFQRLFLSCGQHRRQPGTAESDQLPEVDDEPATAVSTAVSVKSLLARLQKLLVFSPSFRLRDALLALQDFFTSAESDDSSQTLDPFFIETDVLFTDFLDALAIVLYSKQQSLQDTQQQEQRTHEAPLFALVDEFLHALPHEL